MVPTLLILKCGKSQRYADLWPEPTDAPSFPSCSDFRVSKGGFNFLSLLIWGLVSQAAKVLGERRETHPSILWLPYHGDFESCNKTRLMDLTSVALTFQQQRLCLPGFYPLLCLVAQPFCNHQPGFFFSLGLWKKTVRVWCSVCSEKKDYSDFF